MVAMMKRKPVGNKETAAITDKEINNCMVYKLI